MGCSFRPDWVASFLRIRWQLCTGLGGRNHRNTQGWACATANVPDNTFQWLIQQVDGRMIVLSDTAFHAAEGDPANLKLCQRGEWEDRMLVETVLSMLTLVCHFKKVMHREWAYFQARLAFTMALFNVLVQWQGLRPTASGFVPLSIAEFSL